MNIVQQGEKDCGAACLAMVASVSLEEARSKLELIGEWDEPSGCAPPQLLRTLEHLQFSAKYTYGKFLMDHFDSILNTGTAILTVKSKTRPGGWHYIVMHNGNFYDPQEGKNVAIYERGESKMKVLNACIDIIEVKAGIYD